MGDLAVYGGNPQVVATLREIERVQYFLQAAAAQLAGELQPVDFLYLPVKRIALGLEAQNYLRRLEQLSFACTEAADSYFTTEALAMRELDELLEPTAPELAVGALVALKFAGLLANTRVNAVEVFPVPKIEKIRPATPVSIAGLAARIMRTESLGSATIRIDSFKLNDSGLHLVSLPGTQVGGLLPGTNPLDIGSNLRAMASSGIAASEAGVLSAMASAGIKPGDRVVFAGHSQGGLIAANIAAENQIFKTVGLVTFGSPIAQQSGKLHTPTIAIEHRNDPVPKLALAANPNQSNWVTVQKNAELNATDSRSNLVQVHGLDAYRQTAQQSDSSSDPGLTRVKAQIFSEFKDAEPVKTSYYRLDQHPR